MADSHSFSLSLNYLNQLLAVTILAEPLIKVASVTPVFTFVSKTTCVGSDSLTILWPALIVYVWFGTILTLVDVDGAVPPLSLELPPHHKL